MPRRGVRKRLTRKKAKTVDSSVKSPPVSRPFTKRLQWTNQQMEAAMKAVQNGVGVNQAARDHGVPPSTLKDRVSGKVQHGQKPDPKPYLDRTEERELGVFLKECAGIGYGKTRRDVMYIAQSIAEELKEQRKREREERKKQREEEQKKKAAERAKKAEERAQKKAQIEERARKAEIKAKKAEAKNNGKRRLSEPANSASTSGTTFMETETPSAGTSTATLAGIGEPSASASTTPPNLRSNRAAPVKDPGPSIDVNVCCVCSISYEEDIIDGSGAEWVSCSCGRWLHEDCADDCVLYNDGKERLCPFCLDIFHAE